MSTMDILNLLNRPSDILTPGWYADVRNLITQSQGSSGSSEAQSGESGHAPAGGTDRPGPASGSGHTKSK